jgi:hypothetical protein
LDKVILPKTIKHLTVSGSPLYKYGGSELDLSYLKIKFINIISIYYTKIKLPKTIKEI